MSYLAFVGPALRFLATGLSLIDRIPDSFWQFTMSEATGLDYEPAPRKEISGWWFLVMLVLTLGVVAIFASFK